MARKLSFGSIRILPSDRVQARYKGPDGQIYSGPHTFYDELDALGWLNDTRKTIELGIWQPPTKSDDPDLTVGELVEDYLNAKRPMLRTSSYNSYRNIADNRILNDETLCRIPVTLLSKKQVLEWWRRVCDFYPDTANRNYKGYRMLRSAFADAVEDGLITKNPINVAAAKQTPRSKVKILPTDEELAAIVDNMPDNFRVAAILCLFHGMRIGEVFALQRDALVKTKYGYVLRVSATLSRVKNSEGHIVMERHPPKTNAGYRDVPLLPD